MTAAGPSLPFLLLPLFSQRALLDDDLSSGLFCFLLGGGQAWWRDDGGG